MQRLFVTCFLMVALSLCPGFCRGSEPETDPFPVPQCIQPNVDFWKKVYTEYHSGQGIIHDNQKLDIVYDIVELDNPDRPGAGKRNRQRIKAAKETYQRLLKKAPNSLPGRSERPLS